MLDEAGGDTLDLCDQIVELLLKTSWLTGSTTSYMEVTSILLRHSFIEKERMLPRTLLFVQRMMEGARKGRSSNDAASTVPRCIVSFTPDLFQSKFQVGLSPFPGDPNITDALPKELSSPAVLDSSSSSNEQKRETMSIEEKTAILEEKTTTNNPDVTMVLGIMDMSYFATPTTNVDDDKGGAGLSLLAAGTLRKKRFESEYKMLEQFHESGKLQNINVEEVRASLNTKYLNLCKKREEEEEDRRSASMVSDGSSLWIYSQRFGLHKFGTGLHSDVGSTSGHHPVKRRRLQEDEKAGEAGVEEEMDNSQGLIQLALVCGSLWCYNARQGTFGPFDTTQPQDSARFEQRDEQQRPTFQRGQPVLLSTTMNDDVLFLTMTEDDCLVAERWNPVDGSRRVSIPLLLSKEFEPYYSQDSTSCDQVVPHNVVLALNCGGGDDYVDERGVVYISDESFL